MSDKMFDTNIKMLETIHEVASIGTDLIQKLEANAQTDAQKATVACVKMVVETQAQIISQLLEIQFDIVDRVEKLSEKIEEGK